MYKVGQYVILTRDVLSYSEDSPMNRTGFLDGYQKYWQKAVQITKINDVKDSPMSSSGKYTIEDSFGVRTDQIDYVVTFEEHPEMFL